MTDLMQTAMHEAGHAIVADELGLAFDVISIIGDEWRAGRVGIEGDDAFSLYPGTDPFSPENERAFREWAEQQAVCDYAGHAALVALLNVGDMSEESAAEHGAGPDFDKASGRLAGDTARMAAAKARALELVTRRGDEIRKVAAALLEHERLDAQEVAMVLMYGAPRLPGSVG